MRDKHNRVLAFLIDIMLVTFLSMCISQVHYMNPYLYDYEEAYEKYNEDYKNVYDLVYDDEGVDIFIDTISPSLYNLEKKGMFYSIWYLIFSILYFGIFAYYTNGQTIGKKIFKIKITNEDGNPASLIKMISRSLLNGSTLFLGINIIIILKLLILLIGPNTIYFGAYTIVSLIGITIEFLMVILFLFNKNNKALNDLIFKTRVESVK